MNALHFCPTVTRQRTRSPIQDLPHAHPFKPPRNIPEPQLRPRPSNPPLPPPKLVLSYIRIRVSTTRRKLQHHHPENLQAFYATRALQPTKRDKTPELFGTAALAKTNQLELAFCTTTLFALVCSYQLKEQQEESSR
jgi:hypothetical protein